MKNKNKSKLMNFIFVIALTAFTLVILWQIYIKTKYEIQYLPELNTSLKVDKKFSISVFAKNLDGSARVMRFDPEGNLFVSLTSTGKVIVLPDKNKDGKADEIITILEKLDAPHGIDFFNEKGNLYLYIAERDGISRWLYNATSKKIIGEKETIINLSKKGKFFTRTIKFGPDDKLYISVGASCETCVEIDRFKAAILSSNPDGSNLSIFATGLRNAVFFAFHPETNKIWAAEMGHDLGGHYLPPDEINIVEEGKNYGWPYCYGNNTVDTALNLPYSIKEANCLNSTSAIYEITAHAAPLGIAFIPDSWNYKEDLLVAFHGTRNIPKIGYVGYKVARLDTEGEKITKQIEFVSGVIDKNLVFKEFRPVDLIFKENELYISSSGSLYFGNSQDNIIFLVKPK